LLLCLGVAGFVAAALQASGAYYALAGGIAGGVVVVTTGVLLIAGRRPSRAIAAFACVLVLLGVWSATSPAWGGLPHTAWRFLGLTISVAAAAVAGSCFATSATGQKAVVAGVGLGVVGHAVYELALLATHSAPASWFYVRYLDGPVGYHNAEAAALVVGLPIAVWAGAHRHRWIRVAGAASASLLVGAILSTQSRGAIVAAVLSAITQIVVSRRLRVAALAAALACTGAVLFFPLRALDRALVDQQLDSPALSKYVGAVAICAVVLGALSVPNVRIARRPTRRLAVRASVVGGLVVVVAGVVTAVSLASRVDHVFHRLTREPNSTLLVPGGETRLSSVSLTGRTEQWRMAADMASERPIRGYGTGTFARRWGHDRTSDNLYVLQPHSLEMELLSELGVVGLALLIVAVVALGLAIARGVPHARAVAAVAAAASVAFFFQASTDWVFSFPAVFAPLVAVASAASPGSLRTPGLMRTLAYAGGVLVGVFVLSGPALASFELERAREAGPARFASAWSHVTRARSFDRWDPAVVSYEGFLAESDGKLRLAASLYRRAATLSQQPWADQYREARALKSAGLVKASRAVCLRAINSDPLEHSLRTGVCANV
jgi:hypothetical protein